MAARTHPDDFAMLINAEIDGLLMSIQGMTPAELLSQAIDELLTLSAGDHLAEPANNLPRRFRLSQERQGKVRRIVADTGLSENDVAIAAIRQYARNHPS